jgi:hypothetical protein
LPACTPSSAINFEDVSMLRPRVPLVCEMLLVLSGGAKALAPSPIAAPKLSGSAPFTFLRSTKDCSAASRAACRFAGPSRWRARSSSV